MADPLSIAASIAGLVTLADIVFDRLVKFGRSVKNAKEEIDTLCKEVNLVGGALNSLARLARALEKGSFETDLRMHNIENCDNTLQEIDKKLKKWENPSTKQKLKWPFTKDRVREWLDELSRHKANINLALSANSLDAMMQRLAQEKSHAKEILTEVKETRKITSRIHKDDHRREVLEFFLKYNPQQNYDMSLRLRHPRTGLWLTRLPEFRHWLTTPDSKLWLKGIPGAGKTVLAATIIESALEKNTETTPTAFFFCDYKDTKTQIIENILSALVYQLAIQKEEAYGMLEQHYSELHPKTGLPKQASRRGLGKLLSKILTLYDHAYLVIDGLDECGNSTGEVVDTVFDLSEDADNVSIALLSRDEHEIRDRLGGDFVPIEVAAHKGDITEFITAEIEERIRIGKLHINGPDLKGEILQGLVDGAKGMFRWVACQLDHLGECDSDQQCREALKSLPPTLDETYARILGRVPKRKQRLTELALNCIAYASPKITIYQLREMLSVPAPGELLEASAIIREESITRYCSSLIRKSTDGAYLEFSHFSVREFLEKDSSQEVGLGWLQVSMRRAYHLMAIECLKYVQLKNFHRPEIKPDTEHEQIKSRNRLYPLYQHASQAWPVYARGEWENQAIFESAASLFHPSKTSYFTSWAIEFAHHFSNRYKDIQVIKDNRVIKDIAGIATDANYRPLHMAAALSLPQICSFLVRGGARVDLQSPVGTPLQCAVQAVLFDLDMGLEDWRGWSHPLLGENHEYEVATIDTIRYLCRAGASLDIVCCHPFAGIGLVRISLQLAAEMEDFQILTALIQEGACVKEADVPDEHDFFPEDGMESSEYQENLQAFLEFLDSCDHPPPGHYRLSSLLWRHAISKKLPITSDPTKVDTRISMTIDELEKEAAAAATAGNLQSLQRIMRDPRFEAALFVDEDGNSLLHLSMSGLLGTSKSDTEIVNLLLEAGCDPTKPDKYGMSPLQMWNWRLGKKEKPADEESTRFDEVARLLGKSGASCAHQNSHGRNALHSQIYRPHLLEALLKYQSAESIKKATETVDKDGYTPLALSLRDKCTPAASILLAQQTTITPDIIQSPISPLSLAVSANDEASFEALLLSGLDFPFYGTDTPLHHVGYTAATPFVRRLKSLYPKACESQYHGLTPLQSYLESCFETGYQVSFLDASVIDELSIPDTTSASKTAKASVWDHLASLILKHRQAFSTFAGGVSDREKKMTGMAIESLIRLGYLEAFESVFGKSGLLHFLQNFGISNKIGLPSATSICEIIRRTRHWNSLCHSPRIIRLLKAAFRSNELQLLKLMLEKGVSVHQRCDGFSGLETLASTTPSPGACYLLLEHSDKSLINDINPDGSGLGLIHLLRDKVSDWLMTKIVDHGADVNLRITKAPRTPALVYYINQKQEDCAIAILKNGADPTLLSDYGYDAALSAALWGQVSVLGEIYNATKNGIKQDWHDKMNWHRRGHVFARSGKVSREYKEVTALHLAAGCQSVDTLSFYIDHSLLEDLDVRSGEGYTPLHLAASHGSVGNIDYLCARDCNVNARAHDGSSPLHLAARNNRIEAVKELIGAGCKSFPDSSGMTPSFYAYLSKNEELVALLDSVECDDAISRNDSVCHTEIRRDKTLALVFREAAINGDLELCQRLVANGCNLDAPLNDSPGGSLLSHAIVLRQVKIVEWMLQQEASMTTAVSGLRHGELVIHMVLRDANLVDVLATSLQNYMKNGGMLLGENPNLIYTALWAGNVEGLDILLQHASDNRDEYGRSWSIHPNRVVPALVNETVHTGLTPLHVAAQLGDLRAVQLLLKWGANINSTATVGRKSPLHCAITSFRDPRETVALFLIRRGAELEWCDVEGQTPAHLAVEDGRMRSLRALIAAQANVHTPYGPFTTIPHRALDSVWSTPLNAFSELIRLGVDPHLINPSGWSAFHAAMGCSASVSLLLNSDLLHLEDSTAPYPWNAIHSVQRAAFVSTAYPLFQKRYERHTLQRFANLTPTDFESPLCKFAKQGCVLVLENLLQLGASIDWEGCPSGSALMAACTSGSADSVKFLVRRGAALSYTGPNGFRSAIASAKRYNEIVHWLLADRFVDQKKLTSFPHYDHSDNDMTPECFSWGGPVKAELVISGRMERLHHESSRQYWSRLMEEKAELRGKIPPLNAGRRTVFRSCLNPQDGTARVRIHPQGYNAGQDQKDQFANRMSEWRKELKKDCGCWYISYTDTPLVNRGQAAKVVSSGQK